MRDFTFLQDLARFATSRERRSDFYRVHYGLQQSASALTLSSLEEWQSLRPVTKDDLLAAPLSSRSFLPLEALDHIRASSGTSGKGVLFSPRTHVRNMSYRSQYHDFRNPFMTYTVPMMPHWHESVQADLGIVPRVISYDPKEPDVSAQLAKSAGVDGLSLFVYHVRSAGESLKKHGVAEHIRFLEITGEVCSRALFDYIRETFPNATIVQSYGASEVEDVHIGMPCRPMTGEEPLALFHQKETHYLEILDSETSAVLDPGPGVEGDLLITAFPGEPSAFPLLRFRIGDTIRVHEAQCAHGSFSFSVIGRTALDFLKITGGVLRVDEVERILRGMKEEVTDEFQLHRYDRMTPEGPKQQVIVALQRRGQADLESLADVVAEHLRVNPSRTYAEGVRDGMYLPLVCVDLDDADGGKHQRLIAH